MKKYNNTGEEPLEASSDEQSEDEDGSSADDLKDDHGNVGNITPPEVGPDSKLLSNGGGGASWPVRKASALLAMCFNGFSWVVFNDNANANVFGLSDLRNLTALARAAETVEQCDSTLRIMESQFSLDRSYVEVLYRSLLILLVRDNKEGAINSANSSLEFVSLHDTEVGSDDVQETGLSKAISESLHKVGDFLIKPDGSVDMIAHNLLDNLYFEHQSLLPSPESQDLVRSMLHGFNTWSGTGHQIKPSKPVKVLFKCLEWCQQQFQYVCSNTDRTPRLDLHIVPGPHQVKWKNHIEMFGTLWARLEMEYSCAGGRWPEWASESVEAFNVSHAEVLACVCWMITHPPSRTFPAGGQAFGAPGSSLFANACTAAGQIAQLPALEMWTKFRKAFVQFNKPTLSESDTGDDRDFKAAVVSQFLVFMDETLGAMNGVVGDGAGGGGVGGGGGGLGDGRGMGGGDDMGGGDGPSQYMFFPNPTESQLNDFMSQQGWGDMVISQCADQGTDFLVDAAFTSSAMQPRA